MTAWLLVVFGSFVAWALMMVGSIAKTLIEGEIRGAFHDRLKVRIRAAAAELPPAIAAEQESEWLAELAALDRPRLAFRFVRGLRAAARSIAADAPPVAPEATASPQQRSPAERRSVRDEVVALNTRELLRESKRWLALARDRATEEVFLDQAREIAAIEGRLVSFQWGLAAPDETQRAVLQMRERLAGYCVHNRVNQSAGQYHS